MTLFESLGIEHKPARALEGAGYHTPEAIMAAADDDLLQHVDEATVAQIRAAAGTASLDLTVAQADALRRAGYVTAADLDAAVDDDLLLVDGIGEKTVKAIRKGLTK